MEKEKKVKKEKKDKKPLKKMDIAAIVMMVIISIGIIGIIAGSFFAVHLLSTKPELDLKAFSTEESSEIYDRNNELIAELGYVKRENISYDKLPNVVIDAFIATEDSRFFTHPGFDISRFSKAILENLKSMSFAQGGSTFTMQLVKNTYFMDDETGQGAANSVERKLQEIVLALELDGKVSKNSILENYLNKINYGGSGNIRGIEKAAKFYFSKSVSDLNLNEAAFLAGVINAPNANNPYNSYENANERKNQVLYLMNLHGYISDTEYKMAKKVKVEDLLHNEELSEDGKVEEFKYQAYIDEVIKEVERETGFNPLDTPMKIYTNMDPNIQEIIDDIQKGGVYGINYPEKLLEVASVIVNNHTGEILGILGGRNYAKGGALILNHATEQFNQPGSSIKPLLDYSLAFENLGWSTSHVLLDEKVTIDGSVVVSNFSGTYGGQTTIKDAVFNSLNTTAATALQEVAGKMGREYIVEYMNNIGLKADIDSFNMQYSYGGSSFQVSAKTLASAQSTLFNNGVHVDAHTIKKVEFLDGREPVNITPEKTQAISAQAAYLTTELLKNNVNAGHWLMGILRDNYQTYAKTGTSDWGDSGVPYDIPIGAAKDEWMVSSSADFTVASWLGYEKAIKGKGTYLDMNIIGYNIPGKINNILLDTAYETYGGKQAVERPSGISSISHIIATFPYATPIKGMDEKYITSGLIKSDSVHMVNPKTETISNMNGEITLTNNEDGTYNIKWPVYPDQSKLKVAPDKMKINGGTGKCLFDYSWAFGPVKYKAIIKVNGAEINNIAVGTNSHNFSVNAKPGDTIEVCGFYGFEKNDSKSNISCKSITIEDKDVILNIPSNSSSSLIVNAWAALNGVPLISQDAPADELHPAGTYAIYLNGAEVTGQTVTLKSQQIASGEWIYYSYN